MARIKSDSHGPYVIGGGYLWRPVFPPGYSHAYADGTILQVSDEVRVHHTGGTQLAWVKKDAVRERWFAHGMPAGQRLKPGGSDLMWRPGSHGFRD